MGLETSAPGKPSSSSVSTTACDLLCVGEDFFSLHLAINDQIPGETVHKVCDAHVRATYDEDGTLLEISITRVVDGINPSERGNLVALLRSAAEMLEGKS